MDFSLSSSLVGSAVSNPDKLALDLQFALDKTLTARKGPTPVFARGSTGTFVGSNGLIQSAAINAPRFDHDPITGACKGLLMEESRTNSLAYSEDFANAYWGKFLVSTPSNTSIAPNGNSVNTSLQATSTAYPSISRTISITTGSTITLSVFAKQLTSSILSLELRGTSSLPDATFDLLNGTATGIGVITPFSNGWYRCSISKVINATSVVAIIGLGATAVVGNSILIWGGQIELGSFATSYIPTTTGALTRSSEGCNITGSAFASIWNGVDITVLFKGVRQSIVTGNYWALSSGLLANTVQLDKTPTTERLAGGGNAIIIFPALGSNQSIRTAHVIKQGDYAGSLNGSTALVSSSSHLPAFTYFIIGNAYAGATSTSVCISEIKTFRKRLSNAKLQAITV